MQLWEPWQGREFRSIVKKTASHHAHKYSHLAAHKILYVARPNEKVELFAQGRMRIGAAFFSIWNILLPELQEIRKGVAELAKRKNTAEDSD